MKVVVFLRERKQGAGQYHAEFVIHGCDPAHTLTSTLRKPRFNRARIRPHSQPRRLCQHPELQRSVSVIEQTPKSQLSRVKSSSVLTLHSAARANQL